MTLSAALAKVTFSPTAYANKMATAETITHGVIQFHHLECAPRSLNVLDGAINVLMMRAPSDSGAASGTGDDATGGRGAAAIYTSWQKFRWNSSRGVASRQAPGTGQKTPQECVTRRASPSLSR